MAEEKLEDLEQKKPCLFNRRGRPSTTKKVVLVRTLSDLNRMDTLGFEVVTRLESLANLRLRPFCWTEWSDSIKRLSV